jgi:hypothetical protein
MTPGLVWRYGQGRGLWYAAGLAGPVIVLACAIAPRTIPLLLGENDQRLRLPAVIALVVTIALGPSFARGLSDAEWLYRPRLRIARAVHLVVSVVLVAAVALAVAGTLSPNKLVSEVFLNGLGLLGVCLITVMLTPLPPWVATLVIVGTTYVVGTDSDTGRPYVWAWLLWTDRSGLKAAINLVLFGTGVVLFLLRPGRVSDASD